MRMNRMVALLSVAFTVRAACPTPMGPQGWQFNIFVPYGFNVGVGGPPPNPYMPLSIPMLGIDGDINQAATVWTASNYSQNPTNVGFYYVTSSASYYFAAWQINYPGDPYSDPGKAAYTGTFVWQGTDILTGANTSIYYGSIDPYTGATIIDTNSSDYHTFMFKVALHEIGHTMGLDDQPVFFGFPFNGQIQGQSVMNGWYGDDDAQNNIPTSPTACDNASAY